MVDAAESGNVDARAEFAMAYRVHVGRLIAGHDDEQSEEAEAGALLAARHEQNVHELREALPQIVRALAGAAGGGG